MPNDAKLGLVVGVGLVIAVGVVFHRKDGAAEHRAAIEKVEATKVAAAPQSPTNATLAKATGSRRHTVQAGETLTSLAKQYLGDESKASAIRDVNPTLLATDEPAEGTVLVIPESPADKQ